MGDQRQGQPTADDLVGKPRRHRGRPPATALERGGLHEWQRIAAAINAQPWGVVARAVEAYLAYERPYGLAPLMERAITSARSSAEAEERSAVAARITELVSSSGLTRVVFAAAIGTSPSRLSTYCTGSVTPSAALMPRMERGAHRETAS